MPHKIDGQTIDVTAKCGHVVQVNINIMDEVFGTKKEKIDEVESSDCFGCRLGIKVRPKVI